ncbi:MAG TPA: SAM-dependent methyltransferase [Saprospiraceae bacterium]|nr:SAM-dependent methyltransferase [Saprospiraceae bacterium]MCB9329154.1 SAM-dependent methyltransferase [Lewinellaceae bacterium]HPK09457.1 SAM-dependent methyltransferase [Saprospiraceae bacterium]HPQ20890.1 SAM-dependent methyltransferase [Saprospiraceae bacterium]
MKTLQDLLAKLKEVLEAGISIKMSFSKPRNNGELKKINIDPYLSDGEIKYQMRYTYATKDEVRNIDKNEIVGVVDNIVNEIMYNALFQSVEGDFQILQNKKNFKIIPSKTATKIDPRDSHDRKKNYLIRPDRKYLALLGISSESGNVFNHTQKKFRQINKYVELLSKMIDSSTKSLKVADMGCGKGYLSFALYDYLTSEGVQCELTGYEIREDIVNTSNEVARTVGYDQLTFETKDIQNVVLEDVDMVIALHACDTATDMAIAKGIAADAKYIVVAPCCQKQVRRDMTVTEELRPMLKHGIFQERVAEMATDAIRALLLESRGYDVKVFEFISSEHTGKNIMITAVKGQGNKKALHQIDSLKQLLGVKEHELESLLKSIKS